MRCYFDHNATTAVCLESAQAMLSAMTETFGNASSIHHYGQAAKQVLEDARRDVSALLGATPAEIVFTSGGTESNNLALFGVMRLHPGGHLITAATEHPAVLNPATALEREGFEVTVLPVNSCGMVDPEDLRRALRPETALVSVMHANNETGTIQPIAEIAALTREAGVALHVDGVQAAGKLHLNLREVGADLYSVSGHKLYAPKGVGALYVRKGTKLAPILFGGHHERDRRPGTENVAGAAALGSAARIAARDLDAEMRRIAELRDRLERGVVTRVPQVFVNGDPLRRLPNTSNLRFDGIEGEAIVIALDLRGFAISSGSACSSGAVEPSHVLLAMGLDKQQARSSVRISLGRENTETQVEDLIEAIAASVAHLRKLSPAYV